MYCCATRKSILASYVPTTSSVCLRVPACCFPNPYQLIMHLANLVLTECYERIAARNPDVTPSSDPSVPRWLINDVKLPGVMTVRGENVTICATVDLDREEHPRGAKFAEEDQVRALAASQKAERKEIDSRRAKALRQAGIEPGFGMQG